MGATGESATVLKYFRLSHSSMAECGNWCCPCNLGLSNQGYEKWGQTPHLLRSGRIDVALRTSLENLSVYAFDSRGARRGRILSSYSDGWLKFTADISMFQDDATFLYEIAH